MQTDDIPNIPEIRANTSSSQDCTDVFLSHARLYVFAEQYDVQPLKRLAMNNLHFTLKKFSLWWECVEDVVALIKFVYEKTSKPDNEVEPMRNMLMLFIGYVMDSVVQRSEFQNLLMEDSELLNDFCAMVAKRIQVTPAGQHGTIDLEQSLWTVYQGRRA